MSQDAILDAIKKDIEASLAASRSALGGSGSPDFDASGNEGHLADELEWEMEQLASKSQLDVNQVPVRVARALWGPAKTVLKRLVRKATFWLYQPLFMQISGFNALVTGLLNRMVTELERQESHLAQLQRLVNTYRAEAESYRAGLAVIRQEANTHGSEETSGWQSVYDAFEEEFRGSEALIKERQQTYISDVRKAVEACGGYVLDIGCGRGEFLELMREAGIKAKGIDMHPVLVQRCRAKGLDVEEGDVLTLMHGLPDEGLAAMTAFQVVEHLAPVQVWHLIQTSFLKLQPGGLIILETVNSDSVMALRNFYLDPTHRRPLPPATLRFLLEAAGFQQVETRFSSPPPSDLLLKGDDENVRKLNDLLFGRLDYAALGWRR